MNKVYNTVWNESTGTWVVTSELNRKGGRRPRQIKRTALAGLIAGLLMPSQPVLATPHDNQTLGSGGTSPSMVPVLMILQQIPPLTTAGFSLFPAAAVPRTPLLITVGISLFSAVEAPLVPPSTAAVTRKFTAAAVP